MRRLLVIELTDLSLNVLHRWELDPGKLHEDVAGMAVRVRVEDVTELTPPVPLNLGAL